MFENTVLVNCIIPCHLPQKEMYFIYSDYGMGLEQQSCPRLVGFVVAMPTNKL